VDVVALASVISSAAVGLAGAGVSLYSARRTARTAQEGRMEQRAADGYLKILSLAEQEAQWLDSIVYNLSLDRKELEYGVSEMKRVPKPEVTDRATAAALVSAFASNGVLTSHAGGSVDTSKRGRSASSCLLRSRASDSRAVLAASTVASVATCAARAASRAL
jgi:hypothetical protein